MGWGLPAHSLSLWSPAWGDYALEAFYNCLRQ